VNEGGFLLSQKMNVLQNAIKDTAPSLRKERDRSITGHDLVGKKIRYFIVTKYCQTQRCGRVVKYFPSQNLVNLVYEGDSNATETLSLDSIDWTLEASHSKALELRARIARMKMHRNAIDRMKRVKLLSGVPNYSDSSSTTTPAELMLKLLDGSFRGSRTMDGLKEGDEQKQTLNEQGKEEHHDVDVSTSSEEDSEEGADDDSDETTDDEEVRIALEEERKARRLRYESMSISNSSDGRESGPRHIHMEQYVIMNVEEDDSTESSVMASVPIVSFRKHSLEELEVDRIARIEKHIFPVKQHVAPTTSASQAAARAKLARRSAALHIQKDLQRLQARQERVRMLKALKQKKQRDAERAKLCTDRGIFLGRMFARYDYRRVFKTLIGCVKKCRLPLLLNSISTNADAKRMRRVFKTLIGRVKKCRLPLLLNSISTNADAKRIRSRFCVWRSTAHQLRMGNGTLHSRRIQRRPRPSSASKTIKQKGLYFKYNINGKMLHHPIRRPKTSPVKPVLRANEASGAVEASKQFIRFSDPSVSFMPVFNTPSHQRHIRALFRFSGVSGMFWDNETEGYTPPIKITVKRGSKCVESGDHTQNGRTTDSPTNDVETYTGRTIVASRPPPYRPKKAKPIRTRRKQKARVLTQQRPERNEQNKIHVHDSKSKCFLRAQAY